MVEYEGWTITVKRVLTWHPRKVIITLIRGGRVVYQVRMLGGLFPRLFERRLARKVLRSMRMANILWENSTEDV